MLFFAAPDWNIWTVNWLINKRFALAVFSIMLAHMALAPGAYRAVVPAGGDRDRLPGPDDGRAAEAITVATRR